MSADLYQTNELPVAAFLCYLFGDESLWKIEFDDTRKAMFYFHAPSLDCEEYRREFHAGTLAIADLKNFWGQHVQVSRLLKDMNRNDTIVWTRQDVTVTPESSPQRPESFWQGARAGVEQRRAEREQRERQGRRPQQHRRH